MNLICVIFVFIGIYIDEHTEPRQAWAAYFTVLYAFLHASAPATGRVDNLPRGYAFGEREESGYMSMSGLLNGRGLFPSVW
jgi:hypothetical protein